MAATDGEARTVGNSSGGRPGRSDAAARASLPRHIARPQPAKRAALRQPRSVEERPGNSLSCLVQLLARQAAREWVQQQAALEHLPRHQSETNTVGAVARARSTPAS
jgi:hypothetical protein